MRNLVFLQEARKRFDKASLLYDQVCIFPLNFLGAHFSSISTF